jgi:predicted nucleotidyltransferase
MTAAYPAVVELLAKLGYNPPMSAVDLSLLQEFKQRAEAVFPGRIVLVMLYGSRARGDARLDSDWDVAVFLQGNPSSNDSDALSDIGYDLMLKYGQRVQTIAIDAARPIDDSSFLRNVYEDGIAA